jgi:hypothetical protein
MAKSNYGNVALDLSSSVQTIDFGMSLSSAVAFDYNASVTTWDSRLASSVSEFVNLNFSHPNQAVLEKIAVKKMASLKTQYKEQDPQQEVEKTPKKSNQTVNKPCNEEWIPLDWILPVASSNEAVQLTLSEKTPPPRLLLQEQLPLQQQEPLAELSTHSNQKSHKAKKRDSGEFRRETLLAAVAAVASSAVAPETPRRIKKNDFLSKTDHGRRRIKKEDPMTTSTSDHGCGPSSFGIAAISTTVTDRKYEVATPIRRRVALSSSSSRQSSSPVTVVTSDEINLFSPTPPLTPNNHCKNQGRVSAEELQARCGTTGKNSKKNYSLTPVLPRLSVLGARNKRFNVLTED